MHAEWIDVSRNTIQHIIHHLDKTIIAVGTTSLRTIESLYWLGIKSREWRAGNHKADFVNADTLLLRQWEAYELEEQHISSKEALESLLEWMNENNLERLVTKTQILIAPGYQFKIAQGLITNFHQPQSTLLLLVAALIGKKWNEVYDYAMKNDFRFLSYGDGSLLWRKS